MYGDYVIGALRFDLDIGLVGVLAGIVSIVLDFGQRCVQVQNWCRSCVVGTE